MRLTLSSNILWNLDGDSDSKIYFFWREILLVQARGAKGSGEGKTLPLGEKILNFLQALAILFMNFN